MVVGETWCSENLRGRRTLKVGESWPLGSENLEGRRTLESKNLESRRALGSENCTLTRNLNSLLKKLKRDEVILI